MGEIALEAEQQSPLLYLDVMIRATSILAALFQKQLRCIKGYVTAFIHLSRHHPVGNSGRHPKWDEKDHPK